ERSVVIGAGTIGLMTLQAVVLGGSPWTAVVEPHPDRRAIAADLGASAVYESGDALAAAAGPAGVDVTFDAVGLDATRRLALDLLRPGGCAVMVGLAGGETAIDFRDVVRRGLTLRGAYAYTDADYDEALALLLDGRAGLGELERVQPLDSGPEAFAELAAGPSSRLKVFLGPVTP
ncbi:MAG TPA: zinc-binding dehydrogenase, partial [Solirubrobacteraceae bacterium]|nr:zinc-binding dehydrogenase [Solirubrobacteraceae bacterium]